MSDLLNGTYFCKNIKLKSQQKNSPTNKCQHKHFSLIHTKVHPDGFQCHLRVRKIKQNTLHKFTQRILPVVQNVYERSLLIKIEIYT